MVVQTRSRLIRRLYAKGTEVCTEDKYNTFKKDVMVPGIVAATYIFIAVLHPIVAEAAKSEWLYDCTVLDGGQHCERTRMVMPFHAGSLTIVAELAVVAAAFLITATQERSMERAANIIFQPAKLLWLIPVGIVYGCGDYLQTIAFNFASAPVVLVIGQSKLFLTAVLSNLCLSGQQKTRWLRLCIIMSGAIASTAIQTGTQSGEVSRSHELQGAALAFLKAGLSSAGAVLTERYYKTEADSFWVVSCRVQLMMFLSSGLIWLTTARSEHFFSGPYMLCEDLTEQCAVGDSCSCLERIGWDYKTCFAALAIVVNGLGTGLALRYLSAVSKAVCSALGTAAFYIVYVYCGFREFDLALMMVILIVCMSSYEYAMERIEDGRHARALKERLSCETAAASSLSDTESTRSPADEEHGCIDELPKSH